MNNKSYDSPSIEKNLPLTLNRSIVSGYEAKKNHSARIYREGKVLIDETGFN